MTNSAFITAFATTHLGSNTPLDPSCKKSCDLIGQEQVAIYFPYKLVKSSYKPVKFPYKLVKICCLWLGLLLGSSLYVKFMGIVARI